MKVYLEGWMPFRDDTERALKSEHVARKNTEALRGIRRTRSYLEQFETIEDLLRFLHDRTGERSQRDAVLLELIAEHQAAPRSGALGIMTAALFPMLDRLYGMLIRRIRRGEADELWSRIFTAFSEVVGRYRVAGRTRNVASNLKWDTFAAVKAAWLADEELADLRQVLLEQVVPMLGDGATGIGFFDLAEATPNHESDDLRAEEREAAVAIDGYMLQGLISASDRALILGVYVGGRSIDSIARELGVSREVAKKRLQRATGRIRIGRPRHREDR